MERKRLEKWRVPRKLRDKVIERDGKRCQLCGCSVELLEVAHILSKEDFPIVMHEEWNMKTLCQPCHDYIDSFDVRAERSDFVKDLLQRITEKTWSWDQKAFKEWAKQKKRSEQLIERAYKKGTKLKPQSAILEMKRKSASTT